MKLAVIKETKPFERRVALTPEVCKQLILAGFECHIEKDAGISSFFEDVAYTLSDQKLTKDEVRERVNLALVQVDILELANDNCYSLSSGQKQLLAIASAVVRSPKLVIADEPTTLLDLPNTKLITKVLHEMPVEQLVLVTHDLELAATCEEMVWITEGRIKQVGSPAEVVEAYRKYFA